MTTASPNLPSSHFPIHTHPRVWLITAATSPIGIALARRVLAHGDFVIAGIRLGEVDDDSSPRGEELREFGEDVVKEGWREKCRLVRLDGRCEELLPKRNISLCQAAVAQAVEAFGRVDILFCCASEAVIGTVEELSASPPSLTLVRDQFETNFFGPVNIIKAVLPTMRKKNVGHIIALTGITGHIGTPGLGMYCASGWALEGFCDSLTYEVAPFNIKVTIVQPNLETNVLTNKITSAPLLPQYAPENNPAPLCRTIIGGLLDRLENIGKAPLENKTPGKLSSADIVSLHPRLPAEMTVSLIAETINALIAIGGHENPPARHIVGFEGVASVKEKLKTVSEELEDFIEASCAVDIDGGEDEDDMR